MSEIINSKVVVAGGAGFLGSHLVEHLIEDRNCEVMVIDNLVSGRREFIHKGATFVHQDITGYESDLLKIISGFKTEYLFNYAACPYIPVSFDRPLYVTNVNAFAAMKLMNAAQEAGVKGILQVSSAEIYGEASEELYKKISTLDPVRPHSTYGASKAMVDFYVQSRWREAKTPAIALRQFNCIGERETHPYVLTEIISQLYRGDGQRIFLGNNSCRDFMYAGDAVRAAVKILETELYGEVFNLGSQNSIEVYELARFTGQILGFGNIIVHEDANRKRPWEIWYLRSDNLKAEQTANIKIEVSLEEAIERVGCYFTHNGYKWCWEK